MGLEFKRKDSKNYIQFTTRYEEDLMEKIRQINSETGISINEIINQSVRYALENTEVSKKEDKN